MFDWKLDMVMFPSSECVEVMGNLTGLLEVAQVARQGAMKRSMIAGLV